MSHVLKATPRKAWRLFGGAFSVLSGGRADPGNIRFRPSRRCFSSAAG
jgi:hypothetical protein